MRKTEHRRRRISLTANWRPLCLGIKAWRRYCGVSMYFKMRERKSPQLSDPSSLHFGGLLLLPSTPSSNTTIWCAETERESPHHHHHHHPPDLMISFATIQLSLSLSLSLCVLQGKE